MKIYLITYDLRKPGQDYAKLYEAIKSLGNWAHPMESIWFVEHPGDARSLCEHLKQYIDANDNILVSHVDGDCAWWIRKDCSDWLNTRLFGITA